MADDGDLQKETAARFERVLPGPIERAWEHITQSEHISGWLGPNSTIEPREGGTVSLADGHIRGVVTEWKPPRLLGYTWNVFSPGETVSSYPVSYVTFELKQRGNDVLLTLIHRPIPPDFEKLTLMGWHTLLDMLGALLRGETPEPRDTIMERNRVRYGVERLPTGAARG